eukprot:CAMPEP_0169390954 /NCGR_PEP_ID=MMETSP1017-20121227/47695_1 /TAXON_ID=342587 /ORGANISM="Karlodinium micrum, Strain CCMP2283" /LENGTH=86 /DNA_ID=CAMNT_0009493531 /DNA_START=386 /DNA_END=646 /DNA_ORIENTATION=-
MVMEATLATIKKTIKLGMMEPNLKASPMAKKLDPSMFFSRLNTVELKVAEGGGAFKIDSTCDIPNSVIDFVEFFDSCRRVSSFTPI